MAELLMLELKNPDVGLEANVAYWRIAFWDFGIPFRWYVIVSTVITIAEAGGPHLGFVNNYRAFFRADDPKLPSKATDLLTYVFPVSSNAAAGIHGRPSPAAHLRTR